MARMLAFILAAPLLLGACAFGRTTETAAPTPPASEANDQLAAVEPTGSAEAPTEDAPARAEPPASRDPYTRLPDLLTFESNLTARLARYHALQGEMLMLFQASGGEWSDDLEHFAAAFPGWVEAAVRELATEVRRRRFDTVLPELAPYNDALLEQASTWIGMLQTYQEERPYPHEAVEAAARVTEARTQVLSQALTSGEPDRAYILAFSDIERRSECTLLDTCHDWGGNPVLPDAALYQEYLTLVEAEVTDWAALAPADGWTDFHARWLDLQTAQLALLQPYPADGFVTAGDWRAWRAETFDWIATRHTLWSEWLTMVSSKVAAAHPLPGAGEEPKT